MHGVKFKAVSWNRWVEAGDVPPQINALIPILKEATSITTKRIVRLAKTACKHLPVVFRYLNRVVWDINLEKERTSVANLERWFTRNNELEWVKMVRSVLKPILIILEAVEEQVLRAHTIICRHTVMIWDVLKNQKREDAFVDEVMMESMMQWSEACAITNRSEREQQNYERAMAVNFADRSIETAEKIVHYALEEEDLRDSLQWKTMDRELLQTDPQWIAEHLHWIRNIAFTFTRAPIMWVESFYLLIIPLFSSWYGDFFNSVSENVGGYAKGYQPGPIQGSIDLLYQLKTLNIGTLSETLNQERDAVVQLGETLIERTYAAGEKNATKVATLEDANIAAKLMAQLLSGNLPDMQALNVLYERRFGTNVKWLTILSTLTSTMIESEVMRIYNAYVTLATVEIVGAKDGEERKEEDDRKGVVDVDLETIDFEELLDRVIPESVLDASEAWTVEEKRDEQRDLKIILSGDRNAIMQRINTLSGLVALSQEDVVSFTRFITMSSAEDLASLRNRIAPVKEQVQGLETLLSPVNRNMAIERMITAKKKQTRYEWYAERLKRLQAGLRGNEIKADFKTYVYAALITLAFYVMWCLVSNLPTVGHYALQTFKMTKEILVPNVALARDPTKIIWTPDITWNLQSWRPLVDYVNYQLVQYGIRTPPEYVPFPPPVTTDIIDSAFAVGSDIVSRLASRLYSAPGVSTAISTAQTAGEIMQDLLTEVNEKDAGFLKVVEYLQNGGNIASFEFAQLSLLTVKVNAWVLPMISVFSGTHAWLMNRRTRELSNWAVAHNFYMQNRIFAVAYLSSFVVIPALNKTILTTGRMLAISTVAGIGSLGVTPFVLYLASRSLAPPISDSERSKIERMQKLQQDITQKEFQVRKALQTVAQISSSTMTDLLEESRKLALDKISETSMVEQMAEVKTNFTNVYMSILKKAVPEEDLKLVAPLLLSNTQELSIEAATEEEDKNIIFEKTEEDVDEVENMKQQAKLFAALRKRKKEEEDLLKNL